MDWSFSDVSACVAMKLRNSLRLTWPSPSWSMPVSIAAACAPDDSMPSDASSSLSSSASRWPVPSASYRSKVWASCRWSSSFTPVAEARGDSACPGPPGAAGAVTICARRP